MKEYEELFQRDPYRIESMDTYSNILYVKDDKETLSYLAHKSSQTDKYRPETCCVIGFFLFLSYQII